MFRRGEAGASALEFALVAPFLVLLFLGTVDFGLAINDVISLRQGGREGARQAVVASFGTDAACPITGEATTANTVTKELICLTKDRVGLGSDRTRTKVAFGADGYATGAPVAVCVQMQLRSTSGMFAPLLADKVANTKVEMRIEQMAAPLALQATEETALPGGSWSWCTVA